MVCGLNMVRCLILRGISDIPSALKQDQDRQEQDYYRNTGIIMADLLEIIGQMKLKGKEEKVCQ